MSYDAWKLRAPEDEQVSDWQIPHERVRVCIECGGIATHALSGTRYCFDHYREQSAVVMGEMAALKADERRDDR